MKIHWSVLVLVPLVWGAEAKWKLVGSDMVLSAGALNAKVVPQVGRVKEFSWGSVEILPKDNQGAMFYPAPQSAWSWPPPVGFAIMNSNGVEPPDFPFSVNIGSDILTARPLAAGKGTSFLPSRTYSYDTEGRVFTTQYGIKNTGTASASVAPWEVCRINPTGAVFFPMGEKINFSTTWTPIPALKDDSLVWVKSPQDGQGKKLFRDGKEGWLAALIDTVLFIKQFQDILPGQFAPGETEIELYTGSEGFEMEQQGPYTTLQPGDSLTWTVKWYVKPIPKSIATAGNHALVDSVRSVLKQAALPVHPRLRPTRDRSGLPFVDVRGRLLTKSDRAVKAGSVGVMTVR